MAIENRTASSQAPRLYRDLADGYPLLTPVGDYAEDATFYRRLFEGHCQRPPPTLLDIGSDGDGRALRYLEWRWIPDSRTDMYMTDMAYLLRDENGAVEVIHDRHLMGLFPRTVWLELIAAAGFEPLVVPYEHSSYSDTGHEVLLGRRPVADGGT